MSFPWAPWTCLRLRKRLCVGLFEAFRLEIVYEATSRQARCQAWIGEDSLSEAAAEPGRVVRVDFAQEGSASGRADVWSAPNWTEVEKMSVGRGACGPPQCP
jgi:hypothetical protein